MLQIYGYTQIETLSGLTCADCRKCKNCAHKNDQYNMCLEPVNTLMSSGIDKVKKMFKHERPVSSERERFVRAIVDRYEGATVKQVQDHYKLYTVRCVKGKNVFKKQYGSFIKRGFAYMHNHCNLDPKELGAIAKWLLDDMANVLYDWDFDVSEKEKIHRLNEVGRQEIGKTVILDNEVYRVIDQEKGNLFVVKEVVTNKISGYRGWFPGSEIDKRLNITWLQNRPEVRKRLIHRVHLLTLYDIQNYSNIPLSPEPYWVGIMPTDASSSTNEPVYVEPGTNNAVPCFNPAAILGLRPAFWICPSEEMIQKAKEKIRKVKEKEIVPKTHLPYMKSSGKSEVKISLSEDLPFGSVSKMLQNLKRDEETVLARSMDEEERDIMIAYLHKEAEEIMLFSKLDREDFSYLLRKYDIKLVH